MVLENWLRSITRLVVVVSLLVLTAGAGGRSHGSPKKQIETILAQSDLSRGFWGIEIASVESGKTLFSFNSDKLFTPASNTKLFTTAAALALIGPEYKFRTTIESSGSLDKYGRLSG